MADPDDDEEISPHDELLRILGVQDDPESFEQALSFVDDVTTTLMAEFSRRFPSEFSAWCEENDIDEKAVQNLIQQGDEDATH